MDTGHGGRHLWLAAGRIVLLVVVLAVTVPRLWAVLAGWFGP